MIPIRPQFIPLASNPAARPAFQRNAGRVIVCQTRKYIADPLLARLLDRDAVNRQLREAFRFQAEGQCFKNVSECLQRFVRSGRRNRWDQPVLIERHTSALKLKSMRERAGPLKLVLYGAGRNYPHFHTVVLACVYEVAGQKIGLIYDGNDRDDTNHVLARVREQAGKSSMESMQDAGPRELQALDVDGQAFPRLVNLDKLLMHSARQWEWLRPQLEANGIVGPFAFPPPQACALKELAPHLTAVDYGVTREVEAYLAQNPDLIEEEFCEVHIEPILGKRK